MVICAYSEIFKDKVDDIISDIKGLNIYILIIYWYSEIYIF